MKLPALILLLGLAASTVRAQVERPQSVEVTLKDKRIAESSGLVRSLRHPGIFWTLNDSGGEPCLFAIDRLGETKGKVRIPKAANFDWEDLTIGRDQDNVPYLFIGDIGDNLKLRATLQIYQVPEPDLPDDPGKETESAEPQIWHLTYPDGRHNAECLMMHPKTRSLYLLTKEENGEDTLYQVPDQRTAGKGLKLVKVMDLSFPPRARVGKRPSMASDTTDAEFSSDGKRLIVATYSYLYEWKLGRRQSLETSLKLPPQIIEPPLTRQMEAVCYDEDNQSLWFTSEQLPTPLCRLTRD